MPVTLIFLLYVLPLLNVVVLLTVNRKVRFHLAILTITTALNIVGLSMLYQGNVADEKTHNREIWILTFFCFVELVLLLRWSRASKSVAKEDAQNPQG